MLHLIKSNRMENLAQALCTVISDVFHDPMAPEFIGIQSRGMKKWLSQVIAEKFGICANVRFMFPRPLLEYVREQSGCRRGDGPVPSLDREMMAWAVLDILMDDGALVPGSEADPTGPAAYLKNDDTGTKAMALSRKIAAVLDDYQVYRPDMLSAWTRSEFQDSADGHAMWQAKLWQALIRKGSPLHDQMQTCLMEIDTRKGLQANLPERISLFGMSSLPPSFLEFFYGLSRKIEVNLFLLTPTSHFFFDLSSPQQQEKMALRSGIPVDLTQGNPLLGALGQGSREAQELLENFDYHEPFDDLFVDPVVDSAALENGDDSLTPRMLDVIQSDILNMVRRAPGADPEPGMSDLPLDVSPCDRSISIHACHSPMREAQVLKDLLLDAFNRNCNLAPHDVVVMVPDIEAYAPFLEAVFSQEPRLPYTVSDRRRRSESETLEAFLNILALKESRLEKSKVMALLASPVIADKFELRVPDQDLLSSLFDRAGVLWGKDGAHRQEVLGQPYEENSWAFGLDRLMAGFALPEGERAFMHGVLPCDGLEGLEAELLGNFAHFIHTLFDALDLMESAVTVSEWAARFKTVVSRMLVKDLENDGDVAVLLEALDDMAGDAERAGFEKKIFFPAVAKVLTARLDVNVSQGSFLGGCMTFCNLMPMRSIPFRLVCLMGMDTKSFPRTGMSPGFDLIRKHPRLGDKQERQEDCGLFLEALLCARDQLIITYTGRSIRDNSPIPCATPVAELEDTVENSFIFPHGFQWRYDHPLHPFSQDYFRRDEPRLFFSYDTAQYRICRSLTGGDALPGAAGGAGKFLGTHQAQERLSPPAPSENDVLDGAASTTIDLSDFIRFFRHPVQYYATTILGLNYPDPGEVPEEREPFRLSGLAVYQLGSLAVEDLNPETLFPIVRGRGSLPFGKKGEQAWERINDQAGPVRQMVEKTFPKGAAHVIGVNIPTRFGVVSGQVDQVYDTCRAVAEFGKLTPRRLLNQWVMHLAFSSVAQTSGTTLMVGRDPDGKQPSVRFEYNGIAPDKASNMIQALAGLYTAGRKSVLPFFADPCFYLARDLFSREWDLSDASLEKALVRTTVLWAGSDYVQGELANRYTALLFQDNNPFSDPETLRMSGVLEAGLAVYQPLLEHLTP